MRTHAFWLVAVVGWMLARLPAGAADATSASGTETVKLGDYVTSSWHSDDFKGTGYREWDPAATSFKFKWQTDAGDQIGRIGVTFGSSLLGGKLSEMRSPCVMSATAAFVPANDHWFLFSIYGWTNPTYTWWSNTAKGWNSEFYIVFYTDETSAYFHADKKLVAIGSVVVDGVTFECYKAARADQSQWWAVRQPKTWGACSVDVKKIFDYWRTQGLADESVCDLGWAIEGFPGTGGALRLTEIKVPSLVAKP